MPTPSARASDRCFCKKSRKSLVAVYFVDPFSFWTLTYINNKRSWFSGRFQNTSRWSWQGHKRITKVSAYLHICNQILVHVSHDIPNSNDKNYRRAFCRAIRFWTAERRSSSLSLRFLLTLLSPTPILDLKPPTIPRIDSCIALAVLAFLANLVILIPSSVYEQMATTKYADVIP